MVDKGFGIEDLLLVGVKLNSYTSFFTGYKNSSQTMNSWLQYHN